MVNNIKIAISGKANSGKNTISNLLINKLKYSLNDYNDSKIIAFADPIKEIALTMFPTIESKFLYGPSALRDKIVPGAFIDGKPLTIRELLLDIGTRARKYNDNVWIDAFDLRLKKSLDKSVIIASDCRFANEIEYLKYNNFIIIKVIRDNAGNINHISETGQDSIDNNKFNYIIDNNKTMSELEANIDIMVENIAKSNI